MIAAPPWAGIRVAAAAKRVGYGLEGTDDGFQQEIDDVHAQGGGRICDRK